MTRTLRLPVAAGLCLVLLSLSACHGKEAQADDAHTADSGGSASSIALPVVGEPARKGDLVLSVTTTGQVRSDAVAELKAETGGTVLKVLAKPGDRVKQGEPLVQLDPRSFDLAVRDAEAQLEQARIRYRDYVVPDSIVSGSLPAERRTTAEARAGVTAAQVALDKAKLDRERATIAAPFNGVVDQVDVAEGERLSAGQAIAKVVDVDNLRIEAQVLEHDLPLIQVGGQALITTPATAGRPVVGRISAVLPLVDSVTRAGRALIRVKSRGVLRPGMYADVKLEARRLTNRVLVPAAAVIERDGRPLVFVVKESRAQWVYINPGPSNGTDTEVLPDSETGKIPVAPGDTVLVEGHLTLTHDAPVRLVTKE